MDWLSGEEFDPKKGVLIEHLRSVSDASCLHNCKIFEASYQAASPKYNVSCHSVRAGLGNDSEWHPKDACMGVHEQMHRPDETTIS
jgi:hypothetical protein